MLTILIWDNVAVVMFVCSNSVFEAEVKFRAKQIKVLLLHEILLSFSDVTKLWKQ